MITTPLLGICWLPSSSVLSIESSSKFFGNIVWNRQCFITFGPLQQTPYVGFWNSVAIFQPSHPFAMETRYSFVFTTPSSRSCLRYVRVWWCAVLSIFAGLIFAKMMYFVRLFNICCVMFVFATQRSVFRRILATPSSSLLSGAERTFSPCRNLLLQWSIVTLCKRRNCDCPYLHSE